MGKGRGEGSKEPELLGMNFLWASTNKVHLLEDVHHPGEHGHVDPDGVAVCVKLILHLRLSCRHHIISLYWCQNSIFVIGHSPTLWVCFVRNSNYLFWDLNSTMWEPRTWGRFNCLKVCSSLGGDALSKVSIIVISCKSLLFLFCQTMTYCWTCNNNKMFGLRSADK